MFRAITKVGASAGLGENRCYCPETRLPALADKNGSAFLALLKRAFPANVPANMSLQQILDSWTEPIIIPNESLYRILGYDAETDRVIRIGPSAKKAAKKSHNDQANTADNSDSASQYVLEHCRSIAVRRTLFLCLFMWYTMLDMYGKKETILPTREVKSKDKTRELQQVAEALGMHHFRLSMLRLSTHFSSSSMTSLFLSHIHVLPFFVLSFFDSGCFVLIRESGTGSQHLLQEIKQEKTGRYPGMLCVSQAREPSRLSIEKMRPLSRGRCGSWHSVL